MSIKNDKIPFVDLSVDPNNFEETVKDLFAKIRPTWKQDELITKTYSEGYINNMKRFHIDTDTHLEDAIVVRVYGTGLQTIVNRETEVLAMQVAYAAGCFQPLLAIFNNGVAYKHAPGRTLATSDLNDPKIIRLATKKLARFVTTDPDTVDLVDCKGQKGVFDKSDRSEQMMAMMLGGIKEKMDCPRRDKIYQEHRLPTAELVGEFMKLNTYVESLSWKPQLSHGDWHLKNMIYDDASDNLIFCDYELCEYRKGPVHDINYLCCTRPILEQLGMIDPSEPNITEESRKLWIRSFNEYKQEYLGNDPALIPEAFYELAEVNTDIMSITHALGMMAFTGSMAETGVLPFEIMDHLPMQRKKWDGRKGDLPGLLEHHAQLKTQCQNIVQ